MNRQLNFLASLLILVGVFTIESRILCMQASVEREPVQHVPMPLYRGVFTVHFLRRLDPQGFQVHFRGLGQQREQAAECEKKDLRGQ